MFLIRGKIMFLIRGSNKLSEAYQRLIRAKMFLIRILIRGLSEDGITKINVVIEHPARAISDLHVISRDQGIRNSIEIVQLRH